MIIYCLFFISCLALLSWIDFRTFILPNIITIPLIILGFSWNLLSPDKFCSYLDSFYGALLGYFLIYFIDVFYFLISKKHGLGMGDAKLLSGIGATLGWQIVLPILFFSAILGLVGGLIWLNLKSLTKNEPFPFGPFLCIVASFAVLLKTFNSELISSFL